MSSQRIIERAASRANRLSRRVSPPSLPALLTTGVTEVGYIYDIGDNWQRRIIVEKLKPAEPGALNPQYLGCDRRCPPEDCGGFPGYYDFLDALRRAVRHVEDVESEVIDVKQATGRNAA